MNIERQHQVILAPHLSEKAMNAAQNNQYVFKVARDASKKELKHAIEKLFNVSVECIQTSNMKPKTKRTGKIMGTKKAWKKAYVTLKEGSEIDLGTEK